MLTELQQLQTLTMSLIEQLQLQKQQNQQLNDELILLKSRVSDEATHIARKAALERLQAETAVQQLRHTTLLEQHEHLKKQQEKMTTSLTEFQTAHEAQQLEIHQLKQSLVDLEGERDVLLRKNEFAKQKVEAIIQRLSMLGQAATTGV